METWTNLYTWSITHLVATGFILLCVCLVVLHMFNGAGTVFIDRHPAVEQVKSVEPVYPAESVEHRKRAAQACVEQIKANVEKEKNAEYCRQRAAFLADYTLLNDIAALCAKQNTTRASISSWDCTRQEWKLRNRIVACWQILEENGFYINVYADGDGSSIFIGPK